ncbi:hypothetical protein CRG98_040553 [Punica granatum]|uniref:Reverse transcriptase/retrotransposon-derived protein RNase H-like domain-containing protein n=1 Tax=Punica granatum TaxID=22663 RepID=A0A2I0I6M1_PUNGR|nr:hypothetical protein CRG98_040553 [Punica granatum]
MQFGGRIEQHKVQVLVDSGASLNFIGPQVEERLRLAETGQQPFAVWVANGKRLVCSQGVEFKVTLYALPVIGVEAVLGVPWLEQLGPTLMNYKEMMMEFGTEGKRHILRGAVPKGTRAVKARSVVQEVTLGAQLFMAVEAMVNTVAEGGAGKRIAKDMVRLLAEFVEALNEATIKDRFPILTIDDMLDELHEASWFTKLDLRAGYHQTRVHPDDVVKTAFGTHNGHYKYLEEVECLGHFISRRGVRVDDRKIEAMRSWPPPKSVTELRGFLGLTGYYCKFVKGYGGIARPLTNLLKNGRFEWSIEAKGTFNVLKTAMIATLIFALPDFEDEFMIEADASGTGIGAVLSQKGRPLAFLSKGLNESKKSWSTYEKEMLADLLARAPIYYPD